MKKQVCCQERACNWSGFSCEMTEVVVRCALKAPLPLSNVGVEQGLKAPLGEDVTNS